MTRAELLTSDQVARVVGITRAHVRTWADLRGISHVRLDGEIGYRYPAAAVRAAQRQSRVAAPRLRLARFIRNPLNHLGAS